MVDRGPFLRQAAEERDDARDVEALLAFRHGAAEDEVLDVLRLHLGDALEQRGG